MNDNPVRMCMNICNSLPLSLSLSPSFRLVRMSAQDQLFNMITKCCTDSIPVLISSIKLLFNALEVCVCEREREKEEECMLLYCISLLDNCL